MTAAEKAPVDRPLRADAERNRQRILDSARELFADRGPDVTLDDVAAHAGVGVGTVYRRFANRDELLKAIALAHIEQMHARILQALEGSDAWAGIVDVMGFVCESIATDRALGAVITRLSVEAPEIEQAKAEMLTTVHAVVDRAHDVGVLRADVVATDFFAFFCMLSAIAEVTEAPAPGTWRRYMTLLLDSIRDDGVRSNLPASAMTPEQIDAAKHARQGRC